MRTTDLISCTSQHPIPRWLPLTAPRRRPPARRDTFAPYVDNRPLLVAGKPEKRTYTALYVLGDEEVGLVSDALVIICQP